SEYNFTLYYNKKDVLKMDKKKIMVDSWRF
ncbi:unnamed protein product, partial [marine sediment metagenome]